MVLLRPPPQGGNDGIGTSILLLATPLKTTSREDFDVYLQDGRTLPGLALNPQKSSLSPGAPLKGGGEWLISPKGRGYSVLTPRHRQGTVAE